MEDGKIQAGESPAAGEEPAVSRGFDWRRRLWAATAVLVVLAAALLFRRGAGFPGGGDGMVLARVNRRVITDADFRQLVFSLPDYYQPYALANRSQVLQDLIDREIIYQYARRTAYARSPEFRRRIGNYRKELLVQEFVQREILDNLEFPDEQMHRYYEENPDAFVQPATIHLSEILVADRAAAAAVQKRLRAGENFNDLAREVSQAPSHLRGGDLGFVQRGDVAAGLGDAAFKLEPRSYSNPIAATGGYYILMVSARMTERRLEYSEAIPMIRKLLAGTAEEEAYSRFIRELRGKSRVKVKEENLEKLDL